MGKIIFAYSDRAASIERFMKIVRPGDVILFKGSHGMHMELVVEAFTKDET